MDRLYRSSMDRMIGGVSGGLGAYLHLDPLIIRLVFVALAMTSGMGLPLYLLLWVLVPARHSQAQNQPEVWQENVAEIGAHVRTLGEDTRQALARRGLPGQRASHLLIVGAILVGIGALVLFDNLGFVWWFRLGKLWPLLLIALGSVMLLNNLKDKH